MRRCPDGFLGDINLLSGAGVFCLRRDEEGIVGCRALSCGSSVPLAQH